MKKRFFAVAFATALSAACLTGAVACSGSGSSDLTADEASSMIAGFTTSPTTISGTWVQDFDLVVDSDNTSFLAFAQDVTSTVTFEIDLTSGNLYYYGKLVEEDGTVTEQIVAKENGTYYYKTSAVDSTELASESAALSMIDSLFNSLTTEKSGWIDTDVFVYSDSWVTDYILLGSTNIDSTNSRYFEYTYSKTEDDGLSIALNSSYVGYTGDSGIVDVGTNDTYTGSTISIVTDSNGYIVDFDQTINNYINFALTSDGIPLYYTGTRSLDATYGGTITHKALSSVEASGESAATTSTISVVENANCTITTYDYALGDNSTLSTASSTVTVGNYVAVKVECNEGYEVASVTIGGTEATNYSGYYCVLASEGGVDYSVVVTVVKEGSEDATTATVVYSNGDHYTVTCYDLDLKTFEFTETSDITDGHGIALTVTCDDGYEVTSVTVNGVETTVQGGKYYCHMTAVTAGAEYTVVVTVAENSGGTETTTSTITVQSNANCTIETYDYKLGDNSTLASTSSTVTDGNYVAVKVTPASGYEVAVVLVNGKKATNYSGYYCIVAEGGTTYNVSVTLQTEGATTATTGTIVTTATDNCTIETYDFKYGDYTTLSTTSTTVTEGNYVAVKVNCDTDYEVSSVTVNGESTSYINGYYCYMVTAVAGAEYNVEVQVGKYATVTATSVEHATVTIHDFNLSNYSVSEATDKVEVGHYLAVLVTCDDGYQVKSVTVTVGETTEDITTATYGSNYNCYSVTTAGATYTITVEVEAAS